MKNVLHLLQSGGFCGEQQMNFHSYSLFFALIRTGKRNSSGFKGLNFDLRTHSRLNLFNLQTNKLEKKPSFCGDMEL